MMVNCDNVGNVGGDGNSSIGNNGDVTSLVI